MAKVEKLEVYKLLGWKRHSKRSLWGHYFRDGTCVDCGLSEKEYMKKRGAKP